MLIAWWYARHLYTTALAMCREGAGKLDRVPQRLLYALADRLDIPRQRSPKLIYFLDYFWRMKPSAAGDNQEESTAALLRQVLLELRRRAVQRLPDAIHYTADRVTAIRQSVIEPAIAHYRRLPHHDYLTTALLTALSIYTVRRAFRRVRNAAEVPLEWYTKQRRLKGWCVAVTDSDNIRFYHAPTVFHGPGAQEARSRRLETINVRLAGIDAPEVPLV